MSKERLEEIEKSDVSLLEGTKFHEHWLWLIEQWYLSDGAFSSLDSEYVDCVEQNRRYRELLESIRYTQNMAKEIQAENPNIKVITPDDILQHILRKVNKELEES